MVIISVRVKRSLKEMYMCKTHHFSQGESNANLFVVEKDTDVFESSDI